ncbi:MAG: sulfatase-like hydrolase/transferase, partial [Planctomycetaceae bacterium]|nr:sulfatase-like hydrolase/transferase [Planctomycetaceae bacterium]
ETLTFIREHKEEPFLAVLAHYAVHSPIEAKRHLTKRYEAKLADTTLPKPLYEPESAGENLLVQNNATYAAMIESVDHGVGRLLNLLERLDLADNTIVVLASDHGGLSARGNKRGVATSNRPFRAGKGHLYEGGLRIPLLVRWPGKISPGQTVDTPVLSTDLFPTFLELAGLPLQPADHRDGVSLAKLLLNEVQPSPRTFFWHNPAPRPSSTGDLFSSAVRTQDLKLLEFPNDGRIELYDLATDPGEATNLADQRPQDRDRLLRQLHEWKTAVGAADAPRVRKKEQR